MPSDVASRGYIDRVNDVGVVASCFISYSHADKPLAAELAAALAARGYRVWIDEGELKVGDSLVEAVACAINQVDFLIALVSDASATSNWCTKEIALAMTGEIAQHGITVLPCRVGDVTMPPTLADKLYLQVNQDAAGEAADRLDTDMRRHLQPSTPLPPRRRAATPPAPPPASSRGPSHREYDPSSPVRMVGIDLHGMGTPRNDGSRGSALYLVPIMLDRAPDALWGELFERHWNRPPSFSTMHRPGIGSVAGDRILLDGTTIEEVEQVHLATLRLVVEVVNRDRALITNQQRAERERQEHARREQERRAREIADRMRFD